MKNEDPDLSFQRYSHDKALGGTSPTPDAGPVEKRHNMRLVPKIFHDLTGDKTVSWELEEAQRGLEELLK